MRFSGRLAGAVHRILQRVDARLDRHRLLEIALLYRFEQIVDEPRYERREPDQRAVDALHHRRKQIFVVTREQRLFRRGCANRLQVARVLVHVAGSDFERANMRELGELSKQLRGE